ncbi:MAG: YihY/virulence factor BrkB family protein [Ignavibacteria bacterium]|nr:YihY/virulence factor BrkB family protein [Ignavibacteria bacterium]
MKKSFIKKLSGINFKLFYSEVKYYALGFYHKFDEDHVWIMSASIAFNIIICIVPITLIATSLLGIYLNGEGTEVYLKDALSKVIGITPELQQKITKLILGAIDELSRNSTLTVIIGSVGILWTASGLFSTIRDVLNRIYKSKSYTFYLWVKLRDIGMVFLILIIFLLSFSSTFILSLFQAVDKSFFGDTILRLGFSTTLLTHLIGLIFTFIMFYLIFKLVPQGYVNQKVAVISSITAGILYEALKFLFIFYLVYFANYQKVYGAYAAIVAVIFWIYYSSLTFVVGAEAGQLYKEKKLLGES